jgi:hypothetical protein
MPSTADDLPDGPRTLAFQAVEDILREDPVLMGYVKTWSTWRGDGNDTMDVVSTMCPYLQLTPVPLPNRPLGESRREAVLGIDIRIATAGLLANRIINFWDAVEDALVRGKPFRQTNVLCYLQGFHAFYSDLTGPVVGRYGGPDASNMFLEGTGRMILKISRTA